MPWVEAYWFQAQNTELALPECLAFAAGKSFFFWLFKKFYFL
jgi:hypothetical protein